MRVCSQLVAKLYRCKHIMAKRREASQTNSLDSLQEHSPWLYDPRAEEVWGRLHEYMAVMGRSCSPDGFKEYLVLDNGAVSLSYIAAQLAEKLFAKKIKQELANDHLKLVHKLQAGNREALSDYPMESDLHGEVGTLLAAEQSTEQVEHQVDLSA